MAWIQKFQWGQRACQALWPLSFWHCVCALEDREQEQWTWWTQGKRMTLTVWCTTFGQTVSRYDFWLSFEILLQDSSLKQSRRDRCLSRFSLHLAQWYHVVSWVYICFFPHASHISCLSEMRRTPQKDCITSVCKVKMSTLICLGFELQLWLALFSLFITCIYLQSS